MRSEELIGLDEPARWRAFLADIPHGWAHSWDNCHAQYLTTGHSTFLYCARSAGAAVACPIAERGIDEHFDITTPLGFSGFVGTGAWPDFPQVFREFARARGYVCGYIALNPLFGDATYIDEHEVSPNTELYVLDLTLDIDVLHDRLARNRRRELRNWSPNAHDIDRESLTKFLVANYGPFMKLRCAGQQHLLNERSLEELCAAPNVLMFGARSGGRVEAVRVIGYTEHGADDLILVHTGEGARHATSLAWSAVHRLIELGVPTYNLGGGVRPGDPVARAKEWFRPERLPFRGLKQVYDQHAYEKLCRRYGRNPAIDDGYFPPYRERDGRSPVAVS